MLALGEPATSQVPEPRQEFVFHAYVDPLFGDNLAASSFNPSGALSPVLPLASHPEPPVNGVKRITGALQHAPYSFQTLSGPLGALAYVDSAFPTLPLDIHGKRVTHVVIHCLPGLYGPRGTAAIDTRSGLPFNGEVFPLVLGRDGVCLQGSSALDTVFDARGTSTSILRMFFAGTGQPPVDSHFGVFVDGICFRSAIAGPALGSGAAIWVQGPSSIRAGITNCTFFGNSIGIALDASSANGPRDATPSRCLVVNNTFFANAIGIWAFRTSGNSVDHAPAIVNNLFDHTAPPGVPTGASSFEGLLPATRLCDRRGSQVIAPPLDFNAFDDSRSGTGAPLFFNRGVGVGTWPAPPASALVEAPPRVDLAPLSVQPRTLFVADALRVAPNGIPSPLDLRLCPEVSPTSQAPGALQPTIRNPLVNRGIDGGPSRDLDIRVVNGRMIRGHGPGLTSFLAEPPSGLNPNAEEAPVCAWDFDSEGFGNPRLALPVGFTQPGDGFGTIDIGADELDRLIVAGYLEGTRIFAGPFVPGAAPGFPDHRRVFFFGVSSTTDLRPAASSLLGMLFPWFQHVQAPTDGDAIALGLPNFTFASLIPGPSLRFLQFLSSPSRNPFMRNLACDVSPHLAMDPHPFWGTYMGLYSANFGPDPYAADPWHENDAASAPSAPGDILSDNPFLFHNRHSAGHALPLGSSSFPSLTFVTSAHLNPPGTYSPSPSFASWIVQPFFQFGPFGSCSNSNLQFGPFCFNDVPSGCPDLVPEVLAEMTFGRRYNLETGPGQPGNSNLQTFLAVWEIGVQLQRGSIDQLSRSQGPPREFSAAWRRSSIPERSTDELFQTNCARLAARTGDNRGVPAARSIRLGPDAVSSRDSCRTDWHSRPVRRDCRPQRRRGSGHRSRGFASLQLLASLELRHGGLRPRPAGDADGVALELDRIGWPGRRGCRWGLRPGSARVHAPHTAQSRRVTLRRLPAQ
jgi:hypothetical protein